MKIFEVIEGAKQIAARKGGAGGPSHRGKVGVRRFRCSSGPRKGRIVAKASTCHAPVNVASKVRMTKTRAKAPSLTAIKGNLTKKGSGISRAVARLNKPKTTRKPKARKK
jgi:hypothetical protein